MELWFQPKLLKQLPRLQACGPASSYRHTRLLPRPAACRLPQGAVALPPTELDTWDVEDDIVASELALERHLAMCEVRCRLGWAGLG